MKKYLFPQLFLTAFLLTFSVGGVGQKLSENIIGQIRRQYAPDRRVAVFDVKMEHNALVGETNLPAAKAALLARFKQANLPAQDFIRVLPDEAVGERDRALVNVSVANIRSAPAESAELASQALLGMPLRLLDKQGSWLRAQTPDGYIGWVSRGTVKRLTDSDLTAYNAAPKIIFTTGYGFAYEQPAADAPTISDLTWGNTLKLLQETADFYEVSFPDGRTAYVRKTEAAKYDEWLGALETTETSLTTTAKRLLGLPYLWGGTSWKGVDCSGFTRTVYLMNGLLLPRDASQQVRVGKEIDTSENFDKLQPGDLLFFGNAATDSTAEKVVHVGIWLGDGQFIHSSGMVQIGSLNEGDANFDEYNRERFLRAKRMLHQPSVRQLFPQTVYNFPKE